MKKIVHYLGLDVHKVLRRFGSAEKNAKQAENRVSDYSQLQRSEMFIVNRVEKKSSAVGATPEDAAPLELKTMFVC